MGRKRPRASHPLPPYSLVPSLVRRPYWSAVAGSGVAGQIPCGLAGCGHAWGRRLRRRWRSGEARRRRFWVRLRQASGSRFSGGSRGAREWVPGSPSSPASASTVTVARAKIPASFAAAAACTRLHLRASSSPPPWLPVFPWRRPTMALRRGRGLAARTAASAVWRRMSATRVKAGPSHLPGCGTHERGPRTWPGGVARAHARGHLGSQGHNGSTQGQRWRSSPWSPKAMPQACSGLGHTHMRGHLVSRAATWPCRTSSAWRRKGNAMAAVRFGSKAW